MKKELSFKEIKDLAEFHARDWFKDFLVKNQNPLSEEILNYRNAWMFIRNSDVFIPDEKEIWRNSLVISNFGEVRFTVDFDGDLSASMECLKTIAAHFTERGL